MTDVFTATIFTRDTVVGYSDKVIYARKAQHLLLTQLSSHSASVYDLSDFSRLNWGLPVEKNQLESLWQAICHRLPKFFMTVLANPFTSCHILRLLSA